ncbi:MAG TPA: hypothetical protein VIL42_03070 [Sphingomicrobium sp.]|jgi:hypothetical protein
MEAWIGGESRLVVVTPEAIAEHLGLPGNEGAALSADERRRFVRDNISLVVAAANQKAGAADHAEDSLVIRRGELPDKQRT